MLKQFIMVLALLTAGVNAAWCQSKTTQKLQEKYKDSFTLFFYNNTLRMLNQGGDKEFDEIIKDIEKMRLLVIKKDSGLDVKKLAGDYQAEDFESIMTTRHQGKTFDIYIKEKNNKTQGMLVLVNDTDNLFVLDILGSIALDKAPKLFKIMDDSSDIKGKIGNFMGKGDEQEKNNKQ